MGGRASKTKPNAGASPSHRGSFQTVVVVVDPKSECVDEMRSTIDGDHCRSSDGGDEARSGRESAAKVSKVQEILEGKIELKKHQQKLEHLPPHAVTNVSALELQFSSSEESDDGGGKKKRRGAKKKTKKRKNSTERTTPSSSPAKTTAVHPPTAPSLTKLKLNDLKLPKKAPPPSQQQQPVQDHFEQIKDAYALAEYSGKDSDSPQKNLSQTQTSHMPPQQLPMQQSPKPQELQQSPRQYSPFKSKQQPSPSSSPSKFFASAFDNWRKPNSSSARSNRSQIMETRDPSRNSPPKSGNHSTPSIKSSSSRDSDCNGSRLQDFKKDVTKLELETFDFDPNDEFSSSSVVRDHAIDIKITEERAPEGASDEKATRSRSDKRNLRIDDLDESIMNDILAEVIT